MNILLVEDDAGIGRFIHRGLQAEGYKVEWQTLGRRARTRLASGLFDAVILDLGLPDADGAELCREARANGVDVPICMLTARAELEDKLEGFRCGADDYVTKPFSMDELLARLSVMIFRGAARNPGRITVGELVLDLPGRTVLVGGERLNFSKREFDLLHCLARQAGRVVSRSHLLDEVWGSSADVSENTVDVYVGYVRRHLVRSPVSPRLETVRGVGFLLRS
nr:response regulator transcription factor [Novosphingobium sp. ERN07]